MDWTPLGEEELATVIANAVQAMESQANYLWELIRIQPTKWTLAPWGDEGGGFWVVGIVGMQVVWYNDIEDGFNLSRYRAIGVIGEYWCNQDDLQHTMSSLLRQIRFGNAFIRSGPPEPLT